MESQDFERKYNTRCRAVKRLMREAIELRKPTEEFSAHPLEDNLFEWHFTVRGPADSDFDTGYYHGRIILPPDYPMQPPSIILLTPNGRFEVNKRICLSISDHHPERWQPSWSIRTALLAIVGFMPTPGNGAVGSLDFTPEERKLLAKKSQDWVCTTCGSIKDLLEPRTEKGQGVKEEAALLASNMNIKGEDDKKDQVLEGLRENLFLDSNVGNNTNVHEATESRPQPFGENKASSIQPTGNSGLRNCFGIADVMHFLLLTLLSIFLVILLMHRISLS